MMFSWYNNSHISLWTSCRISFDGSYMLLAPQNVWFLNVQHIDLLGSFKFIFIAVSVCSLSMLADQVAAPKNQLLHPLKSPGPGQKLLSKSIICFSTQISIHLRHWGMTKSMYTKGHLIQCLAPQRISIFELWLFVPGINKLYNS
jgi:hypothetical protein